MSSIVNSIFKTTNSGISLGKCAIVPSSQMIPASQMIPDTFRSSMNVENYFHLGDHRAHPVLYIFENTVVVDTNQIKITSKWHITAIKIVSYITIIIPLIVGILILIKRRNIIVQTPLSMWLVTDPVKCLQKLQEQRNHLHHLGISPNQWEKAICDWNPHTKTAEQETAFRSCVSFLISHHLLQEEALFKKAVAQYKSPACVQLLLERRNINAQIQAECLQTAVQSNYADIVLLLCNRDMQRATQLFLNKFNGLNENEMRRQWAMLFRLNPIEIVNRMMDVFIQSFTDPIRREEINRILTAVKHDCMQWLPHVSQHDKPVDLVNIQQAYQGNDNAALAVVDKDRIYGMRCFDLVNQLLTRYRENQNVEPQDPKYRQLPTSLNGKRTAAWFTEQIATFRNLARQGHSVELRNPTTSYQTPIPNERYRWGYTLMSANWSQQHVCSSFYNNQVLSSVELSRWHHGRQPLSFTWPDIEEQFQVVITTNPTVNPQRFYQSLIKLVWLIGNTTPLNRGTGSVVESLWAFVHRYWNLPVPILKKEYPQFDVINISSELESYQNIWPRYFEPSTLMPIFRGINPT